jgi:hypothetical protein
LIEGAHRSDELIPIPNDTGKVTGRFAGLCTGLITGIYTGKATGPQRREHQWRPHCSFLLISGGPFTSLAHLLRLLMILPSLPSACVYVKLKISLVLILAVSLCTYSAGSGAGTKVEGGSPSSFIASVKVPNE